MMRVQDVRPLARRAAARVVQGGLRVLARSLALLALAVATSAVADTVGDARKALLSWAGTAELTCGAWVRHAVPTHFARRTLSAARHAIAQPTVRVGQREAASPDAARAAADLRALDAVLSRMQESVARDDRDAMDDQVRQLRALRLAAR
jgi:hypothetical protein